jgi:preprotein translocase subunit SecE
MASVREWKDQSVQFLQEVWIELKKVHWPTWRETRTATVVVIAVVLFFALYLGVVDLVLSQIVHRLIAPRLS